MLISPSKPSHSLIITQILSELNQVSAVTQHIGAVPLHSGALNPIFVISTFSKLDFSLIILKAMGK